MEFRTVLISILLMSCCLPTMVFSQGQADNQVNVDDKEEFTKHLKNAVGAAGASVVKAATSYFFKLIEDTQQQQFNASYYDPIYRYISSTADRLTCQIQTMNETLNKNTNRVREIAVDEEYCRTRIMLILTDTTDIRWKIGNLTIKVDQLDVDMKQVLTRLTGIEKYQEEMSRKMAGMSDAVNRIEKWVLTQGGPEHGPIDKSATESINLKDEELQQ